MLGLHVNALKGRVVLSAADIELAMTNIDEFLTKKKPIPRGKKNDNVQQIQLFDMFNDSSEDIINIDEFLFEDMEEGADYA